MGGPGGGKRIQASQRFRLKDLSTRPDGTITIAFTERVPGIACSLFEVGALMGHLRALLLSARSLHATDLAQTWPCPTRPSTTSSAAHHVPHRPARSYPRRADPAAGRVACARPGADAVLDDPVANEDNLVQHTTND